MLARLDALSTRDGKDFLSELRLYLGAENFVSPEFFDALDRGEVLTVNGSRYVLIEFSPYLSPVVFETALKRILRAGLLPIIAHVERYPSLTADPGRLAEIVAMGCVLQINKESLERDSWPELR